MLQPIQISVSVNIGLSEELQGFLSSVLSREQQPTAAAAPKKAKEPKADKPAPRPMETAEEKQPQPAEVTPQPAAPRAKECTPVDVRDALERTRKRIEGEDYATNTQGESYQKWHNALTAWFKATARSLGGTKPSDLPDEESRARFIAYCDSLEITNDELPPVQAD